MIDFSWLGVTLILPLLGAVVAVFLKVPAVAMRVSLGFFAGTLITATAANLTFAGPKLAWLNHFAVDDLAAPMLPVLALLHLLTLLGTAKSRVSPMFCVRLLIAAFVSLAAVTCQTPAILIALLVLGVLVPLWDLMSRGQPVRGYLIHMSFFVALLVTGWQFVGQDIGYGLLLIALLLRGGIVPLHGWLPTLFQGAAYGTAMVFVLPLMEVLAALRLLLP